MVANLTPDLVVRFKRAVELGRWPDGSSVSPEQREHCIQAIIAYDAQHLAPEARVGYIDKGSKGGAGAGRSQEQSLRFEDEDLGDKQ